eukprot:ctg_196.g60
MQHRVISLVAHLQHMPPVLRQHRVPLVGAHIGAAVHQAAVAQQHRRLAAELRQLIKRRLQGHLDACEGGLESDATGGGGEGFGQGGAARKEQRGRLGHQEHSETARAQPLRQRGHGGGFSGARPARPIVNGRPASLRQLSQAPGHRPVASPSLVTLRAAFPTYSVTLDIRTRGTPPRQRRHTCQPSSAPARPSRGTPRGTPRLLKSRGSAQRCRRGREASRACEKRWWARPARECLREAPPAADRTGRRGVAGEPSPHSVRPCGGGDGDRHLHARAEGGASVVLGVRSRRFFQKAVPDGRDR